MKKKLLITAVSLLLGGILLTVVGLAIAGFDFKKLGNPTETTTYEITDTFENISIEVDTADVRFVKSTDGTCKIVCQEKRKAKHVVSVNNGRLTIENSPNLKWYDHINIGPNNESVILYLTERAYNSLNIITDTGDVDMPTSFLYQNAVIETETGDITWKATVAESLSLSVDTGDVQVKGAGATSLKVESDTGDVELSSLLCQNIFVETETGDVDISGVQCANISLKTDSGDVDCQGLIALAKIAVETDSGDIELDGCDASALSLKTDSGDIEGRLLTAKHYITSRTTGKVRVPDTTGGKCEIITSTGDIYFQ